MRFGVCILLTFVYIYLAGNAVTSLFVIIKHWEWFFWYEKIAFGYFGFVNGVAAYLLLKNAEWFHRKLRYK